MGNSIDIYNLWKNNPTDDKFLEKDLIKIGKNNDLIKNSFKERMSFGTAGIRGIIGAGTNKINIRTIGAAAEAYAQYLIKHVPSVTKYGIVIGHDNRHNSKLFSEEVVRVFSYYKIKSYLFENNELQPTPLISYSIRKLKAVGGVVITASHNPASYNGFKIYNELGAQLTSKYTKIVSENMEKIDFLKINKGKFNPLYINQKLIDTYIKELLNLRLRPNDESYLKIIYSPLHGTGYKLGPKLLHKMNFECHTVKSQMTNDPNFSGTKSPNPEDSISYKKGISLAKKTKSDIVILTDPDADRIGVVVKYKRRYKYLNGNQVAALYLNYKLHNLKRNGGIPKNSYIVKSNVSSDLVSSIASKYGVKTYETHVGFKNIAELIENKKDENFIFAFEESFGFLINASISRDKDALQGLVGITEAANYYKSQNSDLFSELLKLYNEFGFYRSLGTSKKMEQQEVERFFARLINLKKLGGETIAKIEDYRNGLHGLEKTKFLKIYLKKSGWVAIRPSGTEDKIKFYFNLNGKDVKKVVIIEQEIQENFFNLSEGDLKTEISRKTVFKFLFFISILLTILIILLFTVYKVAGDNGILNIFVRIWYLISNTKTEYKFWILLLIISSFLQLIPTMLFIRRAIKYLGSKISYWHAFASALIAICISAVTPFATGGALASYWYLRKKGYSRKILLSTFLMNSLIYQFTMILRTFIFIPLGFWMFQGIYLAGTPTSYMILFLTALGFIFDCGSTIMIALLTMNKRVQDFIIKRSISFLEWIPIITIADPLSISSKYEHQFFLLRTTMKKMFSDKKLVLELLGYESINIFYSGYLFAALALGLYGSTADLYLRFLTGTNLIRSANSMIPTPGGTGTTEWMSKEIFLQLFSKGGNAASKSAEFTGLVRLCTYIIPLTISAFSLTLIYINEKFNSKIKMIGKNDILLNRQLKERKNKFKKYTIIIIVPITITIITVFISLLYVG